MTNRTLSLAVAAILAIPTAQAMPWKSSTGHKAPTRPVTTVQVYEDGSGAQFINRKKVRTFPEDTFIWDCRTMGNKICG